MADDYISRDYTVENMENYPWDTEHDKNAAIHLVRELVPAADVVKVCRCAECAKSIRKEIGDGELVYWCTANFIYRCLDDYCSRGERRPDYGTEIQETV